MMELLYRVLILIAVGLAILVALAGCTTSKLVEYDQNGNVIREYTIEEDVASKLTDEMKEKNFGWYKRGLRVSCEVTFVSSETLVPTIRASLQSLDDGHVSLRSDFKGGAGMAEIFSSMQSNKEMKANSTGIEVKDGRESP